MYPATAVKAKEYFKHRDNIYMRIIPGKKMFNSTMVHEVINRCDIFAVNMKTGFFTVIKGSDTVYPVLPKLKVADIKYEVVLATEDRFAQGDLF